jgi:UDP-GlcNAc3NAcA epimerase
MKIVTIVGARPQFVKAAVVSAELRRLPGVREVLVHTGQHYDPALSDIFFHELGLPAPDHHLGIGSGGHGFQTGAMLGALEVVLQAEKPDMVMVYGDTNSTLAGALAASKLRIKLAHVEAGLRSFNRDMPEEINRVLTDHVSDLLLAPTETSVANLAREGISGAKVRLVGDVMYDAALAFADRSDGAALLGHFGVSAGRYVLATIHRAENTDNPERLAAILDGLTEASRHCPVVMPLHPRTRAALERYGLQDRARAGARLIEPLGFFDMLAAEKNARAVVTDSGGVQKEAYLFGVPCLVVRKETEWTELVDAGAVRLVEPAAIADALMTATRCAGGQPVSGAAGRVVAALMESGGRCASL